MWIPSEPECLNSNGRIAPHGEKSGLESVPHRGKLEYSICEYQTILNARDRKLSFKLIITQSFV